MQAKSSDLLTVPNLESLAEVLGVHRRTLADYARQGCPTVKAKGGGYLIAPSIWWYSRVMMRRQVQSFLKTTRLPAMLEETVQQILADNEKSWQLWIRQEFPESNAKQSTAQEQRSIRSKRLAKLTKEAEQ